LLLGKRDQHPPCYNFLSGSGRERDDYGVRWASVLAKKYAALQKYVLCSQQDSLLLSFGAFWNMPVISECISHGFPFSMGEQNNERLSCEQGFIWKTDFQLISALTASASSFTLLSCSVRQQTPSLHLHQRVIMENEMERTMRTMRQSKEAVTSLSIYVFN